MIAKIVRLLELANLTHGGKEKWETFIC